MNTISRKLMFVLLSALAVIVAAGCASRAGMSASDKMQDRSDSKMQDMSDSKMQGMSAINLDGSHEVPPVNTTATGNGAITVSADKSVRGSVTTTGIEVTAAHIHEGAAGTNGPVIIKLAKGADNTWVVPTGAMLSDKQYASYMSGNLYVNVHSAANPNGEIRAQLNLPR